MKHLHASEISQFKSVLESYQASRIENRLAVLDTFLSIEEHVTLSQLEQLLQERQLVFERSFLEETMTLFCHFGFAKRRAFETRDVSYEHHHLGVHHDHFICTMCGHIEEFANPALEELQLGIAREHGFHPLQHRMEIYGLCNRCLEQREPTIPLVFASVGEKVRVVAINGGHQIQSRLAAMGLHTNSCVEIIHKNPPGPFIVAAKGSRMALGHDLAKKIMVVHACRHAERVEATADKQ
ncbi:MAG: Fur family transcriptional regulator [Desulfobacteraceae bacterium]|nr:MAG: Fur family transcriptional regulator [Desulfobacteraceae bacterium]